MKQTWYWGMAGAVLMASVLVVPPGQGSAAQSGASSAASASCPRQEWTARAAALELEAAAQRLAASEKEMESRAAREVALAKQRAEQIVEQQVDRLSGRRAELDEEADKAAQSLAANSEQLAARAQEMADQAVEAAKDQDFHYDLEDEGGWLGVDVGEVTPEKAKEAGLTAEGGVLVRELVKDSPAAKAGLKTGDIITEYNGERVQGSVEFRRLVRETPAGRAVQITVWRDGNSQKLSVQIGSRREEMEQRVRVFGPHDFKFHFDFPGMGRFAPPLLGVSAEDVSGQLGDYFGVPGRQGVLVEEVNPGSPAEKAGLKAGDVIIRVDSERVMSTEQLRKKLREKREQKTLTLNVVRKGKELSLHVTLEGPRQGDPPGVAFRTTL